MDFSTWMLHNTALPIVFVVQVSCWAHWFATVEASFCAVSNQRPSCRHEVVDRLSDRHVSPCHAIFLWPLRCSDLWWCCRRAVVMRSKFWSIALQNLVLKRKKRHSFATVLRRKLVGDNERTWDLWKVYDTHPSFNFRDLILLKTSVDSQWIWLATIYFQAEHPWLKPTVGPGFNNFTIALA